MPHISDDQLEEYALGRLSEAAMAEVEEHLLVCEACRLRADETQGYVDSMRDALRRLRPEDPDSR